jgi:hypothetical protein
MIALTVFFALPLQGNRDGKLFRSSVEWRVHGCERIL